LDVKVQQPRSTWQRLAWLLQGAGKRTPERLSKNGYKTAMDMQYQINKDTGYGNALDHYTDKANADVKANWSLP
jgi:hypothetical protein